MNPSCLNSIQAATLLVSAGYGIGILFGSGELAVTQGMAGSLYAWVTGFGMLLLAIAASPIWAKGVPIWDMLGQFYGPIIKRSVALLSVVWMTGVLAAQILGGTAILTLIGLPHYVAMILTLLMIFGASKINLGFASHVFAFCLFGSNAVLVYVLFQLDGLDIYFNAVPRLVSDIQTIGGKEIFVITIGVAFLVVTGADYQQFVIAARSRIDAIVGCVFAAVLLLVLGALPASAVIAANEAGVLSGMTDAKQVIPFLISHTTAQIGQGWETVFLVGLLSAALGAGAAIVRAMASAVASSTSTGTSTPRLLHSTVVILLGGLVAARAQGIVDTIVDLNIVYIVSVTPLFIFFLLGVQLSQRTAQKAITAGFVTSISLYIAEWLGLVGGTIEIYSLCIGILVSTFVLVVSRYKELRAF
jgi:solute:Na+ symporter, SSS family